MICFNGHKCADLWGREERQFFLNDLETQLTDRGRICLGFNPGNDGRYCSDELRDYFKGRGAPLSGNQVLTWRSRRRRITQTA